MVIVQKKKMEFDFFKVLVGDLALTILSSIKLRSQVCSYNANIILLILVLKLFFTINNKQYIMKIMILFYSLGY